MSADPKKSGGLASDFTVAMGSKIVGISSTLLLLSAVARMLPPSDVGKLVLALSTSGYLAVVADFGLNKTVLKMVAQQRIDSDRRALDSLVVKLLLISSITLFLVCLSYWLLSHFLPKSFQQTGLFVSCWAFINAGQLVLSQVFRGRRDILRASICSPSLTFAVSLLFVGYAWIAHGPQTLGATFALLVCAGLLVLVSSTLILLSGRRCNPNLNEFTVSEIIQSSVPLWISQVVMSLLVVADIWVVGAYFSDEQVGVYGLVSRLIALAGILLVIVNSVLAPRIAELYGRGQIQQLQNLLRRSTTLASAPSAIILTLFLFFGTALLEFFFGERFGSGGTILAILCIGQLANVLSGPCGLTLVMTGNSYPVMLSAIISTLIAAICTVWLLPRLEMLGVAISFSFALLAQQAFLLLATKLKCNVWTHASYLYPLGSRS